VEISLLEVWADGQVLDAPSMRSAILRRDDSGWQVQIICDRESDLYARVSSFSDSWQTDVLLFAGVSLFAGRARFTPDHTDEGDVATVVVTGLGALDARPRYEVAQSGIAWLAGARSIPVAAIEVEGRMLAPPSMRSAALLRNEYQWALTIHSDWGSDLANSIRRNGVLRGVPVLLITPDGMFSGNAWFEFGGEPESGLVKVKAYGVGALHREERQ